MILSHLLSLGAHSSLSDASASDLSDDDDYLYDDCLECAVQKYLCHLWKGLRHSSSFCRSRMRKTTDTFCPFIMRFAMVTFKTRLELNATWDNMPMIQKCKNLTAILLIHSMKCSQSSKIFWLRNSIVYWFPELRDAGIWIGSTVQ